MARLMLILFLLIIQVSCDEEISYGSMIDAGSGGTRIYVFKWTAEKPLKILPVDTNYSLSLKPGISPAMATQSEIDAFLAPLLRFAESKIPSNRHASSPLFFKATAGLRLLSQDQVNLILTKVGHTFSNSKFMFLNDNMGVISGVEEGLFNWLTINAIHETLFQPPQKMFGALDLGGASTQISFLPSHNESLQSQLIKVHLFNQTYNLYARSFLGSGINEARKRMEKALTLKNPGLPVNPCLPKGYSRKSSVSVMDGSSNHALCSQYARQLMTKEDCHDCSISGLTKPMPQTRFNARDHYVRIVQFLQLPASASIADIDSKAKQICGLDYNEYKTKYGSEPQEYCFEACYLVSLLRDGLGFDQHKSGIEFRDEIGGIDTSWTLGAMYYEIGNIRYEVPNEQDGVNTLLSVAAVAVFGLALVGVFLARSLAIVVPKAKKK